MKLFGKYHKFAARITILFLKEEMFEKQNKIISNFKPKKLSTDVAVLFNLIKLIKAFILYTKVTHLFYLQIFFIEFKNNLFSSCFILLLC